jgi:hypothetical protein
LRNDTSCASYLSPGHIKRSVGLLTRELTHIFPEESVLRQEAKEVTTKDLCCPVLEKVEVDAHTRN